jgi:uncharacterized protein (DUF362 family)
MDQVSFVKIQENNIESMKKAILESLDLIGYSFEKETNNIVIKPNMCYYWDYSTGQTTDPRFVGALIDVIRNKTSPNVEISIVESDASAMKCRHAFKMLGYEKLAQDYNLKLVNLSEDRNNIVEATAGGQPFHLKVPQTIQNADLKINVPKIKYTIEDIKLTCALKNVFGCNPYSRKFKYHPRLREAIVAINKIMGFDFCLIDGNIVSGAQPRRLGLVMAGKDPVAVDAAAARIAGLNPKRIGYLQLAQEEGLGNMFFSERGESLQYFRERYPKTSVKQKITDRAHTLLVRSRMGSIIGLG